MKKVKAFAPLNEWLLVKPDPTQESFGTSFVSADDYTKRPNTGEVIAVGPGRGDGHPIPLNVGDRLYFQQTGLIDIELNGENLVLIHLERVLGAWQ